MTRDDAPISDDPATGDVVLRGVDTVWALRPREAGLSARVDSACDFPILDKLDETAAIAAIVQPVRRRDVEYAPEAVERSLGWTEGYPFYIQQLGKHAWNLADSSPITRADVEAAIPAAQQVLDRRIYEVRFQRATEAERRYMRAMADGGRGPYRTRVVAKRLAKPTSTLSPIRQRLIDKGLIYATEDYGFIDFTVPRFDEFVRRRMEL